MPGVSGIEWTDVTWNPVTGCTKMSTGCLHCYAERMAKRLQAMGTPSYARGFRLTPHPELLDVPLHWRKPRNVFVNSMSDLFHEEIPVQFVEAVFETMNRASRHRFQVLTKRARVLSRLARRLKWTENIWAGVSVETEEYLYRVDLLREVPATIRFLSLEPLLGPLPALDLSGVHWVIVGGESGPGARPLRQKWVLDIRDQCLASRIPFFFKQWGGVSKKRAGRRLEGRLWDQFPVLR